MTYEIIESASDPNRPWQLVVRNATGDEHCRVGFATYGEAWRAAEQKKSGDDDRQANFITSLERQQSFQLSDYSTDILAWSEHQATLLRRVAAGEKVTDQIDWENVVEEVEAAGRRQLAQVRSLLIQALACLLKTTAWPWSSEVQHWRTEALGLQREAADIIGPSIRRRIDINEFYFKALRKLPKAVDGQEPQPFPTECPVTLEELLGD